MKTLVCLSGGIDSTVVLAMSLAQGIECEAIAFDYGQPHSIELSSADAIAKHYQVPLQISYLPHLPKSDDVVFAARNLLFAAHGVAVAASNGFNVVALGCNQSDWERFPDCRPEFWAGVRTAARAYGISVSTPLLRMTKAEVMREAIRLSVPTDRTWSCYAPQDGRPCKACLACSTREAAAA